MPWILIIVKRTQFHLRFVARLSRVQRARHQRIRAFWLRGPLGRLDGLATGLGPGESHAALAPLEERLHPAPTVVCTAPASSRKDMAPARVHLTRVCVVRCRTCSRGRRCITSRLEPLVGTLVADLYWLREPPAFRQTTPLEAQGGGANTGQHLTVTYGIAGARTTTSWRERPTAQPVRCPSQ